MATRLIVFGFELLKLSSVKFVYYFFANKTLVEALLLFNADRVVFIQPIKSMNLCGNPSCIHGFAYVRQKICKTMFLWVPMLIALILTTGEMFLSSF